MPGPGGRGAVALTWVILSAFLHFSSLYLLFATLPVYVADLGGSARHVALVTAVFALTSLLTRPAFGAWMDRAGRKPFLVVGAAIYLAAALGYLGIRSVAGVLWWRGFHALGLATFHTAASSLAGDLAPPARRGTTMGLFGLAQAGALAVAPGLGTAIQGALGHQGLFLAAAAAALGALGCALALPAAGLPARVARSADDRGTLRAIVAPALAQLSASVAYGTVVTFVAVVARDRGLGPVGGFFALLAVSSFAVRLGAGQAYDRWGAAAVLAPAFLAVAAGVALLGGAGGPGPFLAAGALAGLGVGSAHTTLQAHVVDRAPPRARGRSLAAFTASWELGVSGGTVLAGHLADAAGFPVAFGTVAAVALAGLLLLPRLRR